MDKGEGASDGAPSKIANKTPVKKKYKSDWDWEDENAVSFDQKEFVCVRFPNRFGWSKKRYCYKVPDFLLPIGLNIGTFVVVHVGDSNEDVIVKVSANRHAFDSDMEDKVVTDNDIKLVTKEIVRFATRKEVSKLKTDYEYIE